MLYITLALFVFLTLILGFLLVRTSGQSKARIVELENARSEIKRLEDNLSQARQPVYVQQSATGQPNAADVAVGASAAVEFGTAVIEAGHKTIADGAFKVLDSFESTRTVGRAAQKIHDDNVDGVYAAVSGINRALGDAFRGFTTYSTKAPDAKEPSSEV